MNKLMNKLTSLTIIISVTCLIPIAELITVGSALTAWVPLILGVFGFSVLGD